MDNLNFLENCPALETMKQLSGSLAVTREIAAQVAAIQDSVAWVTAIIVPDYAWMRDMPDVTTSWRRNGLAAETASMVAGWKTSLVASAFENSPTQRVLEAVKRDWDPIAKAMKSAQEKWAVETHCFVKLAESLQHNLAREGTTLAATWKAIEAAWALDTAQFVSALDLPKMPEMHLHPAWATPVFPETLEPSGTPQIAPNIILSRRPFKNYRMAESYDLLSDFERDLRTFIHDAMCEVLGTGWEQSRVPHDMYKKWMEKRQKAMNAGESSARLIDYADFTDYVTIIGRNDNWNEVFRTRFGRLQFVQESLTRLQPVRVCTMHSRILSQEMRLILQTETMLLSKRMWN